MINLSTQIPDQETRHALPLVRTPERGQLRIIITTPEILGTYTHWYGGRTQPCRGDACKPCLEGSPSRWLGYLAGVVADGPRHAIIEVPQLAAQQIARYLEEHGTLRGHMMSLARLSRRPNGRVSASLQRDERPDRVIPPPPDMYRCLATLWQIKLADFAPGHRKIDGRELEVNAETPALENDPTHISQILPQVQRNNKPCPEPSAAD